LKRSATIRLVLLGTVAGSALSGCRSDGDRPDPPVSADNTYTNNHHVPGAGYYHAPYHAFFPIPYNSYAAGLGYFQGGRYADQPGDSGLQASRPTPQAAQVAQARQEVARAANANVRRGGFGGAVRSSSS